MHSWDRKILLSGLAVMVLVSTTFAQITDWRAVQSLPGGTKIKVQLKRGHTFGHCFFNGASDSTLACTTEYAARRMVFARSNVKGVYRVHNGALIGFGVGAASGAVLGASGKPVPGLGRGGTALVSGGIMGGLGAFFGMVADPFFHGKAIYRSPRVVPQNQPITNSTASQPPNPPEGTIPCLRDGETHRCLDPSSANPPKQP